MSVGYIDLFPQDLNLKEAGMAVYTPLALLRATCWYMGLSVIPFEPPQMEKSITTETTEQLFSLKTEIIP